MKLNNILNANTWLFIELVVITVVAWAVLDPAVVNLYYRLLPLGYDSGQLIYAECQVGDTYESDENGDQLSPYNITESRRQQMLRQLSDVEGVASVYLYGDDYGSVGYTNQAYSQCCNEGDTMFVTNVNFVPDSHFFETYGLRPLPGSPSAKQLSQIRKQDQQVVLTRSGAIAVYGTADVVGRRLTICYDEPYVVTVAGVVEDFRKSVATTLCSLIIMPEELTHTRCHYVIRLKDGLDARRFVEEHGQDLIRSGKTSFNRISRLMTFDEHLQQMELDAGRTQEVNRSLALALFFLINVMLAVVGTVWLHAKRRTEECGVRRAFGATRRRVLFDFLWRNALLATVAVIIGCIVYLNYAYSGLNVYENGFEYCEKLYTNVGLDLPTDLRWPDRFWSHFLIVSAVVYLIILCTVLIGTAIPAMKIVRTRIIEALRDE
jgi:hypothetical protein